MPSTDPRIRTLLRWYSLHARDLPWRKTRDPYAIFVSEIMLQQTQVPRVIPIYRAWLKHFPDWTSLASAKTPDLLHAWAGLGYNRRALYLREAAKTVCERGIPASEGDWRGLKGVGPYTAAAVHAFVSQKPTFAIDTNIRRVVGRLMLGIPYPGLDDDARVGRALKRLLKNPSEWKALHAFMDFGSMICTSRNPSCSTCPLRSFCPTAKKFEKGIPKKKRKISREKIHEGKSVPDRIYRGRILAKLRDMKSIRIDRIGSLIDSTFDVTRDQPWMLRMLDRMRRDGLLVIKKNTICIPT